MKNNLRKIGIMYAGIILCFLLLATPFSGVIVSQGVSLTNNFDRSTATAGLSQTGTQSANGNQILVSPSASNIQGVDEDIFEQETGASENVLHFSYTFSSITSVDNDDGTIIEIDGLTNNNCKPGYPIVPMKTIKIIIPPLHDISSITVQKGQAITLPMTYDLAPVQEVVPLSDIDQHSPTKPDPEIYNSNDQYPGKFYEVVSVQHSHGVKILIINLLPLQYIPITGEVLYYPDIQVDVETEKNDILHNVRSYRFLQDDEYITNIEVENPEQITQYKQTRCQPFIDNIRTEEESQLIDYVIITNEELRDSKAEYGFQDLVESKIDKGLTATIVTVEEIIANPTFWWDGPYGDEDEIFNDTACQIRNFIKYAYENWQTQYVLLGGDGDGADVGGESGDNIIPTRLIYEADLGQTLGPVASDLYYCCLDGSYDNNKNGVFGESGDGFDIDPIAGEVDLLAEIVIGRAPVCTEQHVSNFVKKTLEYEYSDGKEYLRNVLMVGEHSGFGGIADWGGNYKDLVKEGSTSYGYKTEGIPDLYSINTLYDKYWQEYGWEQPYKGSGGWPKSNLTEQINEGIFFINHCGHGNNYHVMKLDEPVKMKGGGFQGECHDLSENFTNEEYFFLYSQACFPGSFDNMNPYAKPQVDYLPYDSIGEYLVTSEHGAFAAILNTRFGIAMLSSLDGPSECYDREFWDAIFGEDIPNIGKANQDSKEDSIGKIHGLAMRYCYFEITLFGDPELSIKEPPLREHDLKVSAIDCPDYFWNDTEIFINTSIVNQGFSDEHNIKINIYIEDEVVYTETISSLQSLESLLISYKWSSHIVGLYDIVVEAEAVPGEDFLENNKHSKRISVISSNPIKACVLDGFIADFYPTKYDIINDNWIDYGMYPVEVDYFSLNHEDITYDEINVTNADVLIIDTSMPHPAFQWEFTQSEIDAILQYLDEGHNIIVSFDTFGGNNDFLLPLVGLSSNFEKGIQYSSMGDLNILAETHPMFVDIPNPCSLDLFTLYADDGSWDQNELDKGIYIAKSFDEDGKATGALVMNGGSLYTSFFFESADNYYNNKLLYNMIISAGKEVDELLLFLTDSFSGIVGQQIHFSCGTLGGVPPYQYHWDFGDGNSSTVQYPTHIFTAADDYDINVTVTDHEGSIVSEGTTASIAEQEPLQLEIQVESGTYVGLPIQFYSDVLGGVPPYSYLWDFGDGETSDKSNPIHYYNRTGFYSVSLQVMDFVNTSIEIEKTIEIDIFIKILTYPDNAVIGQTVKFYGDISGGITPFTCLWDFGDGKYSAQQNTTHIFQSDGVFNVTLTVSDALNNTNMETKEIKISEPEPLEIDHNGPFGGVVGQLLQFICSIQGGVPPYTTLWDFGDGNTSALTDPTHIYEKIGNYSVSLLVTDFCNNTRQIQTYATISEQQPLQVFPHGPYLSYAGINIQFKGHAEGGVPEYDWFWDFGDGSNSTIQNPIHSYEKEGKYTVNLTVTDYVDHITTSTTFASIYDEFPDYVEIDDDFLPSDPEFGHIRFTSINDGLAVVKNNGTIFIYNGTYNETLQIEKQVSIIGESNTDTIINSNEYYIGIRIKSDEVTLSNLKICNSRIYITSSNTTISNNTIVDNNIAITLYGSSFNTITDNIISHNSQMGIELCEFSSNNIVVRNVIARNTYHGIKIDNSINNTIAENILYENNNGLIVCDDAVNNTIYHNVFIANKAVNAQDEGINSWDDGYPSGGNYWDDYIGIDTDEDGIGDTPYLISELNIDRYPLVKFSQSLILNINSYKKFSSISQAIEDNNTKDGHALLVFPGDYYESIQLSKSLLLTGFDPENTILYGNQQSDIITLDADGIRLSGFTLQNSGLEQNALTVYSNDNRIYHNNFINNSNHVLDYGDNNSWNEQYPVGGNYWDDYCGNDSYYGPKQNYSGSDGIGDSPYSICSSNQTDTYPLMNPWNGTIHIPPPSVVYVDDDYDESTMDFGYFRFNNIQEALDIVAPHGNIYVYSGVYYPKDITDDGIQISKPVHIIGENQYSTIIDGNNTQLCIYVISTNNVSISNLCIRNFTVGIYIIFSQNIEISNTLLIENEYGLILEGTNHSSINNTVLSLNEYIGLYSVLSSNNSFIQNTLEQNLEIGAYIYYSVNNTFYHNTFINNTQHVSSLMNSNNIWFNEKLQEGNYWDDYDGEDSDGDAIGDIPYDIQDEPNQDLYPLMSPAPLGDISGPDGKPDKIVDVHDLLYLLGVWGADDSLADINGDGVTNIKDLLVLLNHWS